VQFFEEFWLAIHSTRGQGPGVRGQGLFSLNWPLTSDP
jgi:hypothetical protein